MAGTPYLIDSNILIRWVQPSDPDYPIVESALEGLGQPRSDPLLHLTERR